MNLLMKPLKCAVLNGHLCIVKYLHTIPSVDIELTQNHLRIKLRSQNIESFKKTEIPRNDQSFDDISSVLESIPFFEDDLRVPAEKFILDFKESKPKEFMESLISVLIRVKSSTVSKTMKCIFFL